MRLRAYHSIPNRINARVGIANKKENLTKVKYLTKRYIMSLESLTEDRTENRLKRLPGNITCTLMKNV